MTREQSDGRVEPEGQRKLTPTRGTSSRWGGKATTVKQQERQLQLPFGTAEEMPAITGITVDAAVMGAPMSAAFAEPKPRGKEEQVVPTMMKEQWKRRRIARRFIQLGVKPKTAWRVVYEGRKSFWALSHSPSADRALRNSYFVARGLESLEDRWRRHPARIIIVSGQQMMLTLG